MPLDPTCGAFVRDDAAVEAVLGGHRYAFCSKGCKRRFTAPERELATLRRGAALALGTGAALAGLAWGRALPEPVLGWVLLALGTAVQAYAGRPFYQGAWQALRSRAPNMDALIAVGTSAAWLFGLVEVAWPEALVPGRQQYYFEVGALVLGFVALGRALEQRMRGQAHHEVRRLLELQPATARVVREGQEAEVAVEAVAPGDVVLVAPGARIPVDGLVEEGHSAVDEKFVTGEGMPVDKRPGDRVIAGTVNQGAPLRIQATHTGGATALSRIVALIGDAQAPPASARTVDRLSAWFVPLVVGVALASLAGWLLLGSALPFAFSAFVAVLLIACPSALGLATPAALSVGVRKGAGQGILIKDADVLERVQGVTMVVFDKTGTLTMGEPALTDVHAFRAEDAEVLRAAAAAEHGSEHPLAKTIVRAARARKLKVAKPERTHAYAGVGVEAEVGGEEVLVGNARLLQDRKVDLKPAQAVMGKLQDEGKTVVLVASGGELLGLLAFADPLRPEAEAAVKGLQEAGIEVALITGDTTRTAQAVGRALGLKRVFAEVTPQGKAGVIKGLRDGRRVVAMVGDGINDAPALKAADVGIAIGSGSEVSLEAADLVLMKSDPRDVPLAIALSRETLVHVRQNLRFAFGYNAILLPIAALGLLNPLLAGLAMAFSSLPVVGNSLRMARRMA